MEDHREEGAPLPPDSSSSTSTSSSLHENVPLEVTTTTARSNSIDESSSASTFPQLDGLLEGDQALTQESAARRQPRTTPCCGSPSKIFGFLFALWVVQLVLMALLKTCGVVEPKFRFFESEMIFDQLELSWLMDNEGLSLLKKKLNESSMGAVAYNSYYYLTQETKRPGFQLAHDHGARAHYPVVMVPGFVTSGLEVWGGKDCAKKHFRQRLWAAVGGARSFLMERDCWKEHMMLDPTTGGDPEGIRLRASSGFEAADYFIANYWVWGKLIENLADVGFTPSTMSLMPYDWRLAFPVLEERDGYLTKLKSQIEDMHKTTRRKVVLTSHSMGALLVHYFFAWVTTSEKRGGGGGGKYWVDRHVHAYVNIAGSHLGVPKAATALLSGEMSDTVFRGAMGNMVVEQFFGRRWRRDLWSTWGSLWSMLPKGGDALWGAGADMCETLSPDDPFCHPERPSPLLAMTGNNSEEGYSTTTTTTTAASNDVCMANNETLVQTFVAKPYHTTEETVDFLQRHGAGYYSNHSASKLYSFHDDANDERPSFRTWHDPTRTPLPHAPNMHVYCLYGTGIDTERAYFYRRNNLEDNVGGFGGGGDAQSCNRNSSSSNNNSGLLLSDPAMILDYMVDNASQHVRRGIRYSDGDGSVPLISLGYMCADAWTRSSSSGLNPSGIPVATREYQHQTEFFTVDDPMRRGPKSSDHVDILGNVDMMGDFLRIVTNFQVEQVQENRLVSNIKEIAAQINAHNNNRGGRISSIHKKKQQRRRRRWGFSIIGRNDVSA